MTNAPVPGRDHALDGLRGLVALIVVAGHILDVNGAFVDTERGVRAAPIGSWMWWIHNTPLSVAFGGGGAVVPVFFVLSGFVLCFPLMRGTTPALWAGYYPRRFVRLYFPVWAAIIAAYFWQLAVPRQPRSDVSWWLLLHVGHYGPRQLIKDGLLILPINGLDTALWSLRYEIVFSALLPVFYFVATRARQLWWLKIALCFVAIVIGTDTNNLWLRYLPGFLLGCILAASRTAIVGPLERMGNAARWAMVGLGIVLLLANSLIEQGSIPSNRVHAFCNGLSGLGALTLLALVVADRSPARAFCESRLLSGPAKYAFSLYLVHEPLVVSFGYLLGGHPNTVLLFVTAYPASLALAWVFFRVLEDPSITLSRRVGTASKRRYRALEARRAAAAQVVSVSAGTLPVAEQQPL